MKDSFFEMRLKPKGDYILKGRWEIINGGINLEHHRFEEITSLRFEKNGDLTVVATTKYVKGNLEKRDYQEKDFEYFNFGYGLNEKNLDKIMSNHNYVIRHKKMDWLNAY